MGLLNHRQINNQTEYNKFNMKTPIKKRLHMFYMYS